MIHCLSERACRWRSRLADVVDLYRFGRAVAVVAGRAALGLALTAGIALPAMAETGAYIVFDVASGEIYARHNADQAWYPASITKLMTTYVVFQMIKSGKLTFNSPVVMSAAAAAQPPSKMGFPVGTVITIDNALKMIMVKSANDVAWALGESVGGSRAGFTALMNDYARRIGMTGSVWDNPNGLPDPNQMTTAHDMGLLARALLREFPDYDFYYRLPGIQLGNRVILNHNHLMDHYPGADGMKTGYICAAGYNVVASATRNGRRVIAVVLGSHGARPRAELAADLFNHAFDRSGGTLFGLGGGTETLDSYRPGPEANQPVRDIHAEICGGRRETGSEESLDDPAGTTAPSADGRHAAVPGAAPQRVVHAELLSPHFDIGPPVKVWLGGADPLGPRGTAIAAAPASTGPVPAPAAVAKPVAPRPSALAPARAAAVRAPGAILPQQPPQPPVGADPAPQTEAAPPAAADTPLQRAFTLFQPPPPPAASPRPAVADAPPEAAAEPAAEPPAPHVPVPQARPVQHQRSAAITPPKKPVAAVKPPKPGKVDKPKKPQAEN